jgi:hypothetical protein
MFPDLKRIILPLHFLNLRNSEMLNSVFIVVRCSSHIHLQCVCNVYSQDSHIMKEEQKNCSVRRLINVCT